MCLEHDLQLRVLLTCSLYVEFTFTMTSLYLININQSINLSDPIKVDEIVIFRTPKLNLTSSGVHIDDASLNLLARNGDTLLHIGFRPLENVIVFNCCKANAWLHEERVSFGDKLNGKNHTVTIHDHGDLYQILANGSTIHYFKKQLLGEASALQYLSGQALLFSDPIVVETYTNWAALIPCLE